MRYWRLSIGLLAFLVFTGAASNVMAAEFSIQPRVAIGSQFYEYTFEDGGDIDTKTTYAFGGLGVTGQVGQFFVDIYGQTNLTEGEDDTETSGLDRETELNRRELNFTAGFAFTQNVSAFAGLKYAELDIEHTFNNGNAIDVETEYFGPFGGVALTFPISNVGSLSVNGSLAYLDGEQTLDNDFFGVFNEEGTSIGYAFGLGWAGRFGPATSPLGYGVGLDYSAYEFDADNDDFDEQTLRLRGEVKYRF